MGQWRDLQDGEADIAAMTFEARTTHPIHEDIVNFENHFDGGFFEGIEQVYSGNRLEIDHTKPTIIVIQGVSGAGKDEVTNPLRQSGDCTQIKTATTRKRRYKFPEGLSEEQKTQITQTLKELEGEEYLLKLREYEQNNFVVCEEKEDRYVWMRPQRPDETLEKYHENLIKEYGLVEHDYHNGALYGMPAENLEAALSPAKISLVVTQFEGAETIFREFQHRCNVVIITILPDNKDQVKGEITKRQEIEADTLEARHRDDLVMLAKFPQITHFYIHNSRENVGELTGLQASRKALCDLLYKLGMLPENHLLTERSN